MDIKCDSIIIKKLNLFLPFTLVLLKICQTKGTLKAVILSPFCLSYRIGFSHLYVTIAMPHVSSSTRALLSQTDAVTRQPLL